MLYKLRSRLKKIFSEGKLYASRKDFSSITHNADETARWITDKIKNNHPFIVSRFGNVELEWYYQTTILDKELFVRLFYFLTFKTDVWRKKDFNIRHPYFIPSNRQNSMFFRDKMDLVIPEIDFLASWSKGEISRYVKLKTNIPKTFIFDIEPYKSDNPWSLALKGKKVLIIHPMVELFQEQMKVREKLFKSDVLPEFEIIPLKALFFGDEKYPQWMDVFNYYEKHINEIDFDISIVGCGTWGMPICKIVKDKGKGVIHLGGATQLMFGVMGKRWSAWPEYSKLVNEYWITEHKNKPAVSDIIEGGCYW
jgi:hypothetical protein